MAGATFEYTVQDSQAAAAFAAFDALLANPRPMLLDIGGELETTTVERFFSNVAPDGTPWPPSSAATQRGTPTLVAQGHLRDSIHHEVDGMSVLVGSALSYAGVHQFGIDATVQVRAHEREFTMVFGRPAAGVAKVSAHSRHMKLPAREFLGISNDNEVAIIEIVGEHWARAAGGGQ